MHRDTLLLEAHSSPGQLSAHAPTRTIFLLRNIWHFSLWRRGMSFSSEGPLRKEVGFIRQITHPLFQNKQLSFTLVYIWSNYSESTENTDTSTMWPWFVVPTKFQPHFVIKVSTRSINHYQIYNIINIYIYIIWWLNLIHTVYNHITDMITDHTSAISRNRCPRRLVFMVPQHSGYSNVTAYPASEP